MKLLRRMIRKIILEDKESFIEDIMSKPEWDEGTLDTFNIETLEDYEQLYPRARKRGRLVKQIWAKHVDREYINSLVYIHWGDAGSALRKLDPLLGSTSRKDELACAGYEPGKVAVRNRIGRFGVVVKGHVSLFANEMDKVYSGDRSSIQEFNPEMRNTSGANRGVQGAFADTYILDRESFVDKDNPEKNQTEAFLDNWKVVAFVFEPTPDNLLMAEDEKEVTDKIREKYGDDIPIVTPGEL